MRGEFGYWVFEGDWQPAQRPSWNYRKEDGGGIILDMFCHWEYVLSGIFGRVKSLSALGATHIKERFDEQGVAYECTADDAAYGTFLLENGVIAQINSSWAVRVNREELFVFAGGWHARVGCCGTARLQGAASREYAEGCLESGHRQSVRLSRSMGNGAR